MNKENFEKMKQVNIKMFELCGDELLKYKAEAEELSSHIGEEPPIEAMNEFVEFVTTANKLYLSLWHLGITKEDLIKFISNTFDDGVKTLDTMDRLLEEYDVEIEDELC